MENRLTNSVAELQDRIARAIPAVTKYAAALGLPADLAERLTQMATDLAARDTDYEEGKAVLSAKRRLLETAIDESRAHATVVRDLHKRKFGTRYCQAWDILGFRRSLMIPRTIPELLDVLASMGGHLEQSPEMGSADLDITAEKTRALRTELSAARTAVDQNIANRDRLFKARSDLAQKARRLLRALLDDLKYALDPMDPRWMEFGFNRPGATTTPDVPENVTVTRLTETAALVKWDKAPRAEYYHVTMQIEGVDAEPRRIGTSAEADWMINDLPPNAKTRIQVSALNSSGESRFSDAVVISAGGISAAVESAADILSTEGTASDSP